MQKALFAFLIVLFVTLPAMAKIVSKPVEYQHAADDSFISNDAIASFQEGMRKAKADWQMVYFGGTVHSFTNPGADQVGIKGIAYNRAADQRSWSYMQVFFREIFK